MFRCRECEVILHEGRNWHASYAARNYRHCMECARAYSRRRYGRLKPNVKHRVPLSGGVVTRVGVTPRDWTTRNRARIAGERRARQESGG